MSYFPLLVIWWKKYCQRNVDESRTDILLSCPQRRADRRSSSSLISSLGNVGNRSPTLDTFKWWSTALVVRGLQRSWLEAKVALRKHTWLWGRIVRDSWEPSNRTVVWDSLQRRGNGWYSPLWEESTIGTTGCQQWLCWKFKRLRWFQTWRSALGGNSTCEVLPTTFFDSGNCYRHHLQAADLYSKARISNSKSNPEGSDRKRQESFLCQLLLWATTGDSLSHWL